MSNTMHAWIEERLKKGPIYGQCQSVTLEMQKVFPELVRVRGHYHCPIWGKREHWWLTYKGIIFDPTASQFPSGGTGKYKSWAESTPEPTGKCMNCDKYCYEGKNTCSDRCFIAIVKALNNL